MSEQQQKRQKKKKGSPQRYKRALHHPSRPVRCCVRVCVCTRAYTPQVDASGVAFWNKTSALELMKYTATNETSRNPIPTVKVSTCNSNQCQKQVGQKHRHQGKKKKKKWTNHYTKWNKTKKNWFKISFFYLKWMYVNEWTSTRVNKQTNPKRRKDEEEKTSHMQKKRKKDSHKKSWLQ